MVIPERVTPSGNTLAEVKLHGGPGFEKMFDVFSYDGMSEEETKKAYFSEPKRKDECLEIIVDNTIEYSPEICCTYLTHRCKMVNVYIFAYIIKMNVLYGR